MDTSGMAFGAYITNKKLVTQYISGEGQIAPGPQGLGDLKNIEFRFEMNLLNVTKLCLKIIKHIK